VFVLLPTTPFISYPQLIMGYNEGAYQLHRLASIRIREWLRQNGHTTALAITRRADRAFMRCFRDFGEGELYATFVRFELGDRL
jgi:hypothetical protein